MKNFNDSSITTVLIAQSDAKVALDIQETLICNLNVRVVGSVNTGKELLTWLLKSKVDIVLSDFYLPIIDGIFLMQVVTSFDKKPKFLFYSDFDYQWIIRKAINSGAYGFLSMKNDINLINNAIDVISKGGTYLDDMSILHFLDSNEIEKPISINT